MGDPEQHILPLRPLRLSDTIARTLTTLFSEADRRPVGFGLLTGAAVAITRLAARPDGTPADTLTLLLYAVAGAGLGGASFWLIRSALCRAVIRYFPPNVGLTYRQHDSWTYAAGCLALAGIFGFQLILPFVLLLVLVFAAAQIVVLTGASRFGHLSDPATARLGALFAASGFAALIYQIVWERVLFELFGHNVESVTLIVACFMLGLGAGALIGGAVSRNRPGSLPFIFMACELGIGCFGLVSLALIRYVGDTVAPGSYLMTGAVIFSLLLVPTLLMGATLPVLSAYFTHRWRNVGRSVGALYAFNTLGSAVACLAVPHILFVLSGLQGAVRGAAILNLTVGLLVYGATRKAGDI